MGCANTVALLRGSGLGQARGDDQPHSIQVDKLGRGEAADGHTSRRELVTLRHSLPSTHSRGFGGRNTSSNYVLRYIRMCEMNSDHFLFNISSNQQLFVITHSYILRSLPVIWGRQSDCSSRPSQSFDTKLRKLSLGAELPQVHYSTTAIDFIK